MKHYYYLHTNGNLIHKPASVVDSDPEYFNSTFVKKFWGLDDENRGDAWTIVLEALALDASIIRVGELVTKWHCDLKDAQKAIVNLTPSPLLKKGLDAYLKAFHNMTFEEFASLPLSQEVS